MPVCVDVCVYVCVSVHVRMRVLAHDFGYSAAFLFSRFRLCLGSTLQHNTGQRINSINIPRVADTHILCRTHNIF